MNPLLTALMRPDMIAALAALIGAGAYAWRGRTSDQSRLITALISRVAALELQVKELMASNRLTEWALSAIRQEYEEYREAVSSGQTPPRRESTNPRFHIATEEQ